MRSRAVIVAAFSLLLGAVPAAHAAVYRPLPGLDAFYAAQASAHPDLVTRTVYGTSGAGRPLVAYRVGRGDRAKPAALYVAAQHGRDWLSAEVERRLFAYAVAHPELLVRTDLWFVPVANPDGYDRSFAFDRQFATTLSGVDTDRNWPDHWGYDDEGSSAAARGPRAASEPEVAGLDALLARIRPRYLIDYRAGDGRILYPESWQVQTAATDAPAFAALAGDDAHPAVAGYDPGPAGELAIANGTLIDHAYHRYGAGAFAVELAGGVLAADDETVIEAEFQKNLGFALDLARSAPDPGRPVSHLGNTAPDFVPHAFTLSYGSPQTVEVNARRVLGPVTVHWTVGGRERSAPLHESAGERYGAPGAVYHRLRGEVSGFGAGDGVQVWFEAAGRDSSSFTFTAAQAASSDVLVLAAEDYSGRLRADAVGRGAGRRDRGHRPVGLRPRGRGRRRHARPAARRRAGAPEAP